MNSILYGKIVQMEGLECATHFVVDPGLVLKIVFWENKASEKCLGSSFCT